MKDAIVFLSPPQRKIACEEMASKLISLGVELLAISVDRIHYHMLARFPTDHVKHWVGLAKKHSAFMMRAHGIAGGVWAIGCRAGPIEDRTHQVHTFDYIRRHARKGAVVWAFRDSIPLTEDPILEERLAELRMRKSGG
jgi:REP element-mobilizing transposase RayT